tara:strand:- start:6932 stop:7351 length:420 start_codon:yes stop_codon:yes gene_type:complete
MTRDEFIKKYKAPEGFYDEYWPAPKKDRFGFGTAQSQAPEEETPKVDLQEWRKTPWSDKTDIPLMKQAIKSIAQGFKPWYKPWYVPESSWNKKRNWYLEKIIGAAKDKEGFPEGMTLRELGLTNQDFVGTNPEYFNEVA